MSPSAKTSGEAPEIQPARRNRWARAWLLRRRLGTRRFVRFALDQLRARLSNDPTLWPPPGYTRDRADAIYGEAFRKCFEYLRGTQIEGDILEFGTLRGYTARLLANLMKEFGWRGRLYLYDSFQGLPPLRSPIDEQSYEVAINKVWFFRQMAVEEGTDVRIMQVLSKIIPRSQLRVVRGYYEETLESHLPESKAALVHIDCDLYSSTRYVLEALLAKNIFQDGSVILFDDFNCNRANPQMGERRAFADTFEAQQRFDCSPFFSYGWHGQAYFIHDRHAVGKIASERVTTTGQQD